MSKIVLFLTNIQGHRYKSFSLKEGRVQFAKLYWILSNDLIFQMAIYS